MCPKDEVRIEMPPEIDYNWEEPEPLAPGEEALTGIASAERTVETSIVMPQGKNYWNRESEL